MTRNLLLFLGERPDAAIHWGVVDGEGVEETGYLFNAEALETLGPRQGDVDRIIAYLPAEQSTLISVPAPPKTSSKFIAAAAFMLEDELSEPIENIHFVTHKTGDSGLAIAARDNIVSAWRDAFAEAGVELDILTTDAAALIDISDDCIVIRNSARTIVANGANAFACDNDLLDIVSSELVGDLSDKRVQCLGEDNDLPDIFSDQETDWLGPLDDARRVEFYAQALDVAAPVNLLQGAYRKKMQWRAGLSQWRGAALIAAGLAAIGFATVALDAWRSGRASARWTSLAEQLHASSFPEASGVDPVTHARGMLSAGGDSGSFLILSARFTEALADNDEIQIDRIGYDSAQGRFSVSVRSQTDAAIEAFREELTRLGVTVRDNGGYRQSRGQRVGELLAELS